MSKFQLFDAVSLTEPIAQNILFHCGTGVSPVHDLWYGRLARTSSAVKIFIDNKKCDRLFPALGIVRSPIPALGLDFKQG